MKLAHLILAHRDIPHLIRLTNVLCNFSDVYIHIDKQTDMTAYECAVKGVKNVHILYNRYHCEWGGVNAVEAEIELMRLALSVQDYDYLVFLQGADYPIKSASYINSFFKNSNGVEFIRGCNCTDSKDSYLYNKCYCIHFRNNVNILKRIYNKLMFKFKLYPRLRKGYIEDDREYKIYWGSAQWALTGECTRFVINFHDTHPNFNKWFYYSFAPDELYFTTIIMNSEYRKRTSHHGAEPEKRGLVNWRNLHYFEYPGHIRIWNKSDFDFLMSIPELYVRKVNTDSSTELLDKIDSKMGFEK